MTEKLTLAQMPDSWVYSELARATRHIEHIVGNVTRSVTMEECEEHEELKAEALSRLSIY